MKLLKSKAGFTLIELLVVIGILAVLAAIAIPSVAGLIDRANVSADKTNANEMTNAVERFTSEYELYCQDIASKEVKLGDLDGAQGRVYNVTGISDRNGITKFESESGFKGKGINRDTKYPVNEETLKAIVENYTKTASATFEPKQSDCEFYYSPEVGVVIVGERGATIDSLNSIAFSSDDDIAQFDTINWICLDNGETDNIATDEQDTFDELDSDIQPLIIDTVIIDGVSYNFEAGMTWEEWCASTYNTAGFFCNENESVLKDKNAVGFDICTLRYKTMFCDEGLSSCGESAVKSSDEILNDEYKFRKIGALGESLIYAPAGTKYYINDNKPIKYGKEKFTFDRDMDFC